MTRSGFQLSSWLQSSYATLGNSLDIFVFNFFFHLRKNNIYLQVMVLSLKKCANVCGSSLEIVKQYSFSG